MESCYTDTTVTPAVAPPAPTRTSPRRRRRDTPAGGYTVTHISASGTTFNIMRNTDGTYSRTCDADKGRCNGTSW